jgi:protein ImuB
VLSRREQNAQRIAALDEQAEALGLKRDMGLADARAMHPALDVVEADPQAERRLLEGLADWCDRYTPLVAFDGDDGLFLDITGCAHLFAGERAMLDDIVSRFFDQGFDVRASVASTAGAAWAAARFTNRSIVEPAGEAGVLAPLPLAALRIEPALCASLEGVGLWTTGSLMTMPRAPLARRFGPMPLLQLDRALGHLEESVSPRRPVAALSVERHLAEPLVLTEDIELLVSLLATTLRADLERRGEGARMFDLLLFRVDGEIARLHVRTSRPVREPRLICRLFHERLTAIGGDFDAGYGFDLVRLSVPVSVAYEIGQIELTGKAQEEGAGISMFVDRVAARLGSAAILRPVAVASHIPERAVTLASFTEAAADKPAARPNEDPAFCAPPTERPIRLFRSPEPIDVPATEMPEGPPWEFRWRRALHRIARAEGPERIASEWWLKEAPPRDYFRVEDAEGRRYWLYREGAYDGKAPPRWFMHGIFP